MREVFDLRASISGIVEKRDCSGAFSGISAEYLGEREGSWRKKDVTNEKRVTHNVTPDYVAEATY